MATKKNPIRRSQLITPWGVGSIAPFPGDESLMIAGLDMWRFGSSSDEFIIKDERLQKRLSVRELRLPPEYREPGTSSSNTKITIPAVRFPRWHYCPFCGTMKKLNYYSLKQKCDQYVWSHGRNCRNSRVKRNLIPERFIVVCPHGHIDDFPIMEWVHHNSSTSYNSETCRLRRSTGGISASLAGVFYECSCGAKRSLAGATMDGALEGIGYKCKGTKPWLGIEEDKVDVCGSNQIKVVQRGGTNVWFPDIYSSLVIPFDHVEADKYVIKVAQDLFEIINSSRVDDKLDYGFIEKFARVKKIDPDTLKTVIEKMVENKPDDNNTETESDDAYRFTEYKVLNKNSGGDNQEFHSINQKINGFHNSIWKCFSSISIVPKIKETRAFYGFSRLQPDESISIEEKKKLLRTEGRSNEWLPAIQVYGEGIFFEFNKEAIHEWAQNRNVVERMQILNRSYNASAQKRNGKAGDLNAAYVLIHTFSHILINQLSFECGYGSSSIRERLYCNMAGNEEQMYGVLLYTASGDSEGSLGGLVRQGKPGRIEDTIKSAVKNAEWCSADPICIQSRGQGPDNCNIAACHNCALLPETCCENGNRFLDRGLLIGCLDDTSLGFFSTYLE